MDQSYGDVASRDVASPERAELERPLERPAAPPAAPREAPARPAQRRTRWLRWLIILALLGSAGWAAWRFLWPMIGKPQAGSGSDRRAGRDAAQPVGVAKIGTGDMRIVLTGIGTVTPLATITVQTQINGQLTAVGYKEGQLVAKGDFLAQIDPRPYQVALEQAEGTLAHDAALLNQAKSDLQRYVTLNRQDSIAKQQVTDQQFLVQQDEGTVMQDQASVDSAKLNLAYCRIVSPVTGRVGLRLVDPGNYVQTSSATGLVVVTQLQPISVIFDLPEDDIAAVEQQMHDGSTLDVGAYDRTNTTEIAKGSLITLDNTVDTTTGTVKLRASFPNTDNALFPNQFVNAQLLLKTLHDVVEAPVAAIQHGSPGTFVYRLKPDGTVGIAVVKTGVTDGDAVQIVSGLKPGDQVVVDGTDRLREGAKVRVTPDHDDPAATSDGPGAPPGQPPQNGAPVPGKTGHRHKTDR